MPTETAEKAPVYTDEHPEYPKLLYNHETRKMKPATDKKNEEELGKQGFVKEPYDPEDVDALTEKEVAELQSLLAKAAKALAKLGKLSEKHEPENAKPAAAKK